MNAYVMTPGRIDVIEGAGWLEVHPDDILLIRGTDPERRPKAAVKLTERLWVAVGEQPPAPWPQATELPEEPAPAVEPPGGAWPPEPPPDVDSEA